MNIRIYTDGSSLGNPGPGGFAAIIQWEDKKHIVKGGDDQTTNNRMELSAVIAALHWVKKNLAAKQCSVFSDSQLVIKTVTLGWKRKKNLDLWEKLDSLVAWFDHIDWRWVQGHSGHKQNTEADLVAVSEAKKRKK